MTPAEDAAPSAPHGAGRGEKPPVDNMCCECNQGPCACPPSVALCWSCGGVIPDGSGVNKDGWYLHALCPKPPQTQGERGRSQRPTPPRKRLWGDTRSRGRA